MEGQQQRIYFVAGDAGAALDLIPVVAILKKEYGILVDWFVDSGPQARAGQILERYKIPYEMRGPGIADEPKVILVGCSTKAIDAQMVWTGWVRTRRAMGGLIIPVLWYDDLFVNSVRNSVLVSSPDVVLVINRLAEQIVKNRRPNVETAVVGKWSPDTLPSEEKMREKRASIRGKHGLKESDFLVSFGFAGEPAERAPAQVEEILKFKNYLPRNAVYAFRFHPAHPERQELAERIAVSGLQIVDTHGDDLLDVYGSSDAVVADYVSTDPYRLLMMGIPVITMLFPDDRAYRVELGYPDGVPPIVLHSKAWGAETMTLLASLLRRIREAPQRAREMTLTRANHFRDLFEPGAAERIAIEVMEYI